MARIPALVILPLLILALSAAGPGESATALLADAVGGRQEPPPTTRRGQRPMIPSRLQDFPLGGLGWPYRAAPIGVLSQAAVPGDSHPQNKTNCASFGSRTENADEMVL